MPGQKPQRPAARPQIIRTNPRDFPGVQRALDNITDAVEWVQNRLRTFTTLIDGLVPAPGTVTGTRVLRDDGTWGSSSGTGAVDSVTAASSAVVVTPTTGAVTIDVDETQFSGIPESGVTNLAADLAARPTGSGTVNKLAKWDVSIANLGDSSITDTGILVTIASPLEVTGAADLDTTLNVDGAATLQSTLTLPLMTAGSVLFAGVGGVVTQDNANLFWSDTLNHLCLGTAGVNSDNTGSGGATTALVEVSRDGAGINTTLGASYFGATNASGQFLNIRGRGTRASPTAVTSGDVLGAYSGAGYYASGVGNFASGANMRFVADGAWSNTSLPGRFEFHTVASGSTVLTSRAALTNAGQLIIGDSAVALSRSGFSASTLIEAVSTSGTAMSMSTYSGTAATQPVYGFYRARGTSGSPTGVSSGDSLGRFQWSANRTGGESVTAGAWIETVAAETWGSGAGTRMDFFTCTNTTTNRLVRLSVENDGALTLNNSSAAAVSAASEIRLRNSSNKLQVSANTGGYVDAVISSSAAVGVANTVPKWTAANAQGISLLTDNATTLSYNAGKFTVTAANGNTAVAGTLAVNGNVTLGDASADSHTLNGNITLANAPTAGTFLVGSTNARIFLNRQILSAASGTYTPTTGTKAVLIRGVGGGGGGGGALGAAGVSDGWAGGGASGAYIEKWIDPAANVTGGAFACGAAGAAGAATPGDGGTGGDSTIVVQTVTYTAKGGTGGKLMNAATVATVVAGGTVQAGTTAGNVSYAGEPGSPGMALTFTDGAAGKGGSSPFGAGGPGSVTDAAGTAGAGNGSGGGGAGATTVTGRAGGAGTIGIWIVDEYA